MGGGAASLKVRVLHHEPTGGTDVEHASHFHPRRRHDREPVTGETVYFVRTAADTDGELVEIEVSVEADGAVAAAHVHPYQSERFEVLEGTLEFRRGRDKVVAGPGEVVTVPAGAAHSFRNVGGTTARFRCEVRPALQFERFLETLFGLAADGKTNAKGMPTRFASP